MQFSRWVTSPWAVYQIVQLFLEPQNTSHFLCFHICRRVLDDAEHLCSCSVIFSLYSHFSGWESNVPYRVLSASLTNTRLCSFIHIYILKIFTAGTVHISFIARFIEHLIPQNTVRIDFFFCVCCCWKYFLISGVMRGDVGKSSNNRNKTCLWALFNVQIILIKLKQLSSCTSLSGEVSWR